MESQVKLEMPKWGELDVEGGRDRNRSGRAAGDKQLTEWRRRVGENAWEDKSGKATRGTRNAGKNEETTKRRNNDEEQRTTSAK